MTPEQIRESDERPIRVLCALTPCLCVEGGEVPCLKHYREAFEVWFYAKYSTSPFVDGLRKATGQLYRWAPLVTTQPPPSQRRNLQGVDQDTALLAKLHLPARIDEHYSQLGWCLRQYRGDGFPLARGQKLSRVAQRYVRRARRPQWSRKKKR